MNEEYAAVEKAMTNKVSTPLHGSNILLVLGAMQRVMAAVSYAQKQGENTFHNYKYVTEADAIAALRPAMVTEGLILIPSTERVQTDETGNTHIVVQYRLYHAPSGECIHFNVPGSGNDMAKNGKVGDKGVYKALTGASKYALLKTFLMETGEDPEVASDHDKQAVGKHTEEEEQALKQWLVIAGTLIEHAQKATIDSVLNDTWRMNHEHIETMRTSHPEIFTKVRNAFTKRKEELAKATEKKE